MAGEPQFGPAPDPGARDRAVTPHIPRDPVALREAVEAAVARGEGVGRIYVTHVRALVEETAGAADAGPLGNSRRAVARSAATAALAHLASRLPTSDEGLGRRAAVLAPPGVPGELDAQAAADGLEAAGWTTDVVALDRDPAATVAELGALGPEVVVVPVADAAQILASQHALSLLRRVQAPPLVVGVAFGDEEPTTVAADHVIADVDALPALLRRRLGGEGGGGGHHGGIPWGVRLHRDGAGLVVAPAGRLDDVSVARLREIVETRRMLYPHIVIDLRDLLDADTAGLDALVSWDAELPWDPTVSALGDPRTLDALDRSGLAGALPLAAFPA